MPSFRASRLTLSAALGCVIPFTLRQAAAGPSDLDAFFGMGGVAITAFPGGWSDVMQALAVQSDGKIIAAGGTYNDGDFNFGLARYTPDGLPDTGFGTAGGMASTAFSGSGYVYCLAVQKDGKIIAAGDNQDFFAEFAMVRYKPNGTIDTTFGTAGKVTTTFGSTDRYATPSAIVLQNDGKIVLAGGVQDFSNTNAATNFVLARYSSTGALDPTFGSGGKVSTDLGGADGISCMQLLSDGKFLVAGSTGSLVSGAADVALARYNPNGSLDTTFGTGGKVITKVTGYDTGASALLLLSGGKFIVAGGEQADLQSGMLVMRYLANGTLDSTFGIGGKVIVESGADLVYDGPCGAVLQSDGKILVAGNSQDGGLNRVMLLRLNADGTPDEGFGPGGVQKAIHGGLYIEATCVLQQRDGKVLVGGVTESAGLIDFALLRYTGTPALTPLQAWRLAFFGTPDNVSVAADEVDPDGDSLPNLTEWACGLDPTAPGPLPYTVTHNAGTLEFTFRRNASAEFFGAVFSVEWTDSLTNGPCTTGGVSMAVVSTDGDSEVVKATLPAGPGGTRYLRLRVTVE
jgi:uncharacterized delta-60 repeat protein